MTTNILKLIPVIQSASILSDNIEFAEKKKKKSSNFIKQGVKNIVGVGLISSTAKIINDFD